MEEITTVNRTYRIKQQIMDNLTKDVLKEANCQSQNEFVNDAIAFYISFLHGKKAEPYISKVILSEINGIIRISVDSIKEVLFKLSVLVYASIYIRVVEGYLTEESYNAIIKKCIEDVKGLNGFIDFPKMFRSIRW